MNTIFVLLLIPLVIMVVVSLVRGIAAFLKSTKLDLERESGGTASEMQLKQNKMMFARIKYQALAIVIVMLLLLFNR